MLLVIPYLKLPMLQLGCLVHRNGIITTLGRLTGSYREVQK